jgi:thiol-disulfide isomerase/thioredoxin
MSFLKIENTILREKKEFEVNLKCMRFSFHFYAFLALLLFYGCFTSEVQYSQLPPGIWRGILKLDPQAALTQRLPRETGAGELIQFDEITGGELPFNFEVVYTSPSTFVINIMNGDERIYLDEIIYKSDHATQKDTVIINFPVFDSHIEAIFEDNVLEGQWVVRNRKNYSIDFVAYHGQGHRFTTLKKTPLLDLSGTWEARFRIETDNPYNAIGEFEQDGNYIEGTFRTVTGDHRYLEGTVQANKLYLSTFDGAHAYLYEAVIRKDGSISGIYRSGTHFITSWEAIRNDDMYLPSPDTITHYTGSSGRLNFTFPNTDGRLVSLNDSKFHGKPKVVQLMGTWCPNCLDETRYILEYLAENKLTDAVFIALAFERHAEESGAMEAIRTFKNELGVPFDVLYAGSSNKSEASRALPMLNRVTAFPTLLFLNRQNELIRTHTGFNGPATSKYHEFDAFFRESMNAISAYPL